MAKAAFVEQSGAFNFNPSAREFVPHEQPTLLEALSWQSAVVASACSFEWACMEGHQGAWLCEQSECAKVLIKPDQSFRLSPKTKLLDEPLRVEDVAEAIITRPERRRLTSGGLSGTVATLVVKNLGLNITTDCLHQLLQQKGIEPSIIEFHKDPSGTFRGTAFVRYSSPGQAKMALDKLGTNPDVAGRKARVEMQKSKGVLGRRSLEAELPQAELDVVREEIESFVNDSTLNEYKLPATFNAHQRKYAHSLAERHNLSHVTQEDVSGEKCVFLSRCRTPSAAGLKKKSRSVPNSPAVLSAGYPSSSRPALRGGLTVSPGPGILGEPYEMLRRMQPFSPILPKPLIPLPPGLYEDELYLGPSALGDDLSPKSQA